MAQYLLLTYDRVFHFQLVQLVICSSRSFECTFMFVDTEHGSCCQCFWTCRVICARIEAQRSCCPQRASEVQTGGNDIAIDIGHRERFLSLGQWRRLWRVSSVYVWVLGWSEHGHCYHTLALEPRYSLCQSMRSTSQLLAQERHCGSFPFRIATINNS